ncbi:hypothetical protein Barb7_03046 [Bacteroidales bacterium Barb7]|nr:hypothetical protein Barb7_03046 [Bacteroidales bacterium Barb7]
MSTDEDNFILQLRVSAGDFSDDIVNKGVGRGEGVSDVKFQLHGDVLFQEAHQASVVFDGDVDFGDRFRTAGGVLHALRRRDVKRTAASQDGKRLFLLKEFGKRIPEGSGQSAVTAGTGGTGA